MFIMSLGEFGDLWDTFDGTKHSAIGLLLDVDLLSIMEHFNSKDTLVHLYVTVGYPSSESSYCHDG